ncbi:MAG TPA: TonB-dependent receptor [Marinagarivorans sp.]
MLYPFTPSRLTLAIRAFSGTLLCAVATQVIAQDASAVPIEEVHIWGTEVKASSIDLGEEAIAIRQADHLSDLLRVIPGVDVGGAHSLNQRVTIRSLDDKDLRISIDGANQNTYMFHHMGNLQIHADILKSADIDVGNNSVINGGLGGVARFETRSARDLLTEDRLFGGRINSTVASNASVNLSITGYAQLGPVVDILGYVNAVDRDNYTVGGGVIKDSEGNMIAGTDGDVRGLKGELFDALIKVGVDISDHQRIKVGYEAYQDEGDYSSRPDMGIATDLAIGNGESVLLPTEFTRDTFTVNYDGNWGNNNLEVAVFNSVSTLDRDELGKGRNANLFLQTGEASNTGFNILASHLFGNTSNHALTYGVDVIQYETEYTGFGETGNTLSNGEEEATSAAIFVQDKIALTDKFTVTPGIRYESWDIDSHLIKDTFSEPTLALAMEYQLDDGLQFKASATELFKGPELSEVFTGAGTGDTYNADIEAETGMNTEFGLTYQGSSFSAGFTAFETVIENYIYDYINYTLPPATYPKDNIGDMRLRGLEGYWGYATNNLNVLLTYASVDSKLSAFDQYRQMGEVNDDGELTTYEGFDGARTDRKQGDTFSLVVDYFIPQYDLQLHYDGMHVSSLPAGKDLDGATLDNSKGGYNVHNISMRWTPSQFAEGLALTFGIDNLFDEYYASQASRTGVSFHPVFGELFLTDYEPGRNVKASVSYQF